MRLILIYGLICIFSFELRSQSKIEVKGQVIDATGNAIPYSHISYNKSSELTFSNSKGYFSFTPDTLPATIIITNVGYEKKEIIITSSKKNLLIQLKEKSISLSEVVITNKKVNPKYIGSPKNPKGVFYMGANNPFEQNGMRIKNIDNQLYENPKLISISVKIARSLFGMIEPPDGTQQLRLRLYNLESGNNSLNGILNQNIFLSPKKGGWYKINLENINVKLPQKGFIIALEWLDKKSWMKSKKSIDPTFFYSPISIKGHEIGDSEKKYYSFWQYNHHYHPDGLSADWINSIHENLKNYIPCIRLEFIELDE